MAKKDESKLAQVNTVHGEPTKDFFITMLIKDITLRDAIGDLVDNSIDAIKSKAGGKSLKGYLIDIMADEHKFSISDNGTGIEEEVAREYAFKLGKPKDHKLIDNSIGRFGIGMKRAFFKLGNNINVNSTAPTSSFTLDIKVQEWKLNEEDWNFEFKTVKSKQRNSNDSTGAKITITDLSEDSKESFKKPQFENDLINEIEREQILNITKGVKIKINKQDLKARPITLKFDKEVTPAFWSYSFKYPDSELKVEVYAGVDEEVESEGGWNIFCNDRLILDRDTTKVTGWTGGGSDGVAKYHQQFWGFRGYVFFSAKNSALLPWNTTKTGIDPDSSDYRAVRKKMIEMMKDVFLLLNRQKKEREKNNPERNQTLNNKILKAKSHSIIAIRSKKDELTSQFKFPNDLNPVKENESQVIKYTVSGTKFNKVKKRINGTNPADVGIKTFDYFFENEIGD